MNIIESEDAWEIPRSEIEVGDKLGQGNYGSVFKGQLTVTAMSPRIYAHIKEVEFEGKSYLNVAVKMLRRACVHCHHYCLGTSSNDINSSASSCTEFTCA